MRLISSSVECNGLHPIIASSGLFWRHEYEKIAAVKSMLMLAAVKKLQDLGSEG